MAGIAVSGSVPGYVQYLSSSRRNVLEANDNNVTIGIDKNVLRFNVAMYNTAAVQCFNGNELYEISITDCRKT